jgi:enoyl-CoA hydratase/carnithine racemase
MTTLIEVINHGPIRELRLARPPVNALDTDLCRQLIHAIELAMAEDAHGIVLSGSERIFTGGMDVPHLLSHGDDKHKLLDTWNAFFGAVRTLAESRIPVVAAITGHAPAGGCVLALCCDYRVMARSADPSRPYAIGLNEVQVGLIAPEGIQRLLRRAVGVHRAGVLLTTGSLVPAEQALQIGLVDELAEGPGGGTRRGLAAEPAQAAAPADAADPRHRPRRPARGAAAGPDPARPLRRGLVRPGCAERPAGAGRPAGQR